MEIIQEIQSLRVNQTKNKNVCHCAKLQKYMRKLLKNWLIGLSRLNEVICDRHCFFHLMLEPGHVGAAKKFGNTIIITSPYLMKLFTRH